MELMPDAKTIKEQQRKEWGRAATGWRKHDERIRQLTQPVSQRLLELVSIGAGHQVLDIACGTGEPALPAARIVGPEGSVLATDMAPEMLEVAREKATAEGLRNVEFRLVDGEELDVEAGSFDAVTCRWGIMFMPAPVRCLRQAWAALRLGGRIAVSVWGPAERNPFFLVPAGVLRKYLESPAPDPTLPGGVFSFADASKLESALAEAGFSETRVESLELTMAEFDSGDEYWRYLREIAGPLATQVAKLPHAVQETVAMEIAAAASGGDPQGRVSLSGYTLLGSAVK